MAALEPDLALAQDPARVLVRAPVDPEAVLVWAEAQDLAAAQEAEWVPAEPEALVLVKFLN